MNSFSVAFLLMLASFVSSIPESVQADPPGTDLKLALQFFECSRKAIITGIPEIGVPSHDPLKIRENIDFTYDLGTSSFTVNANNLVVEGIPWWNVTQAAQIMSDDPNIDIFQYVVYWKNMVLTGDWAYTVADLVSSEVLDENSGTLYVELDHITFSGTLTFVKPGDQREGTITGFTLDVATEEGQVRVSNLGLLGDVLNAVGGSALAGLINQSSADADIGDALKEKLINDWIHKPERIDALIANCRE